MCRKKKKRFFFLCLISKKMYLIFLSLYLQRRDGHSRKHHPRIFQFDSQIQSGLLSPHVFGLLLEILGRRMCNLCHVIHFKQCTMEPSTSEIILVTQRTFEKNVQRGFASKWTDQNSLSQSSIVWKVSRGQEQKCLHLYHVQVQT